MKAHNKEMDKLKKEDPVKFMQFIMQYAEIVLWLCKTVMDAH